jgi:dihydropteroate synthase
MGVINVTPDSFSGDGVLAKAGSGSGAPAGDSVDPHDAALALALEQGRAMAAEGADLLDVGGESTRPGHPSVDESEELRRVIPVIEALRVALPEMPISIDTIKPAVARAALAAGADLINDVWATGSSDEMAHVAAERDVPYVISHNRAEAIYRSVAAEVIADLQRAVERAVRAGCAWESLIVDPGIGFGKTPEQNLELLRGLAGLRVLGRPILLGTSRKSTIGKVLDLPADQRVEGTLATTALGIGAGVDIVRVHDVEANVRAARMSDAVVRGGWHAPAPSGAAR